MICNNQISQVRTRGRGHCEVPSPLQSVSLPCTDQLRHDQTGGTLLTRIKPPEDLSPESVPAEPAPPGQGEESEGWSGQHAGPDRPRHGEPLQSRVDFLSDRLLMLNVHHVVGPVPVVVHHFFMLYPQLVEP